MLEHALVDVRQRAVEQVDRVNGTSTGRAQGKPHREIQEKVLIRCDVQVDEWREPTVIGGRQPLLPGGGGQYLLQHQRINVDHADLQEMQAQDSQLLFVQAVGGDLPAGRLNQSFTGDGLTLIVLTQTARAPEAG